MATGTENILEANAFTVDASNYNKEVAGEYLIIINIHNSTTPIEYTVTVSETIVNKRVDISNAQKMYFYGDTFDVRDIYIFNVYDNGAEKLIDNSLYAVGGYDAYSIGEQTITISVEGSEVTTYDVTVVNVMKELIIESSGAKTQYSLKEELD